MYDPSDVEPQVQGFVTALVNVYVSGGTESARRAIDGGFRKCMARLYYSHEDVETALNDAKTIAYAQLRKKAGL
jgi:hypothetical protein